MPTPAPPLVIDVESYGTVLFTVGHSTRSLDELIGALRTHAITILVDVRRYPGSRRHPHFGQESLREALAGAGIQYRHEEMMGGRRSRTVDSPNGAWRNAAFQGYADHANTAAFQHALEGVLTVARTSPTAVMCAEAVPWRCHRRIIADHAVLRGWRVVHILDSTNAPEHQLHPQARRTPEGTVIYPREGEVQRELWK